AATADRLRKQADRIVAEDRDRAGVRDMHDSTVSGRAGLTADVHGDGRTAKRRTGRATAGTHRLRHDAEGISTRDRDPRIVADRHGAARAADAIGAAERHRAADAERQRAGDAPAAIAPAAAAP